ncbi:MAG TPA: hypothetical protein VEQ65_10310, partial [Opitutus sp.]|nr:hypothetical protein [Opitutus sp.]
MNGLATPAKRWRRWPWETWAGGLIVAAALTAYHNSFGGPFVFDDLPSILDNPSIRSLWPLTTPLSPPNDFGFTVSGRPLVNLSLAFNYAIGGTAVWSYHVFNLVVHVLAGRALFGLVRRTLRQPVCTGWFDETRARAAALSAAVLWTVHPLQTQAVTYV